ncbi:MAG: O-antigen ligase family protein [Rhodospirillales bacterium]|nr:O-antigen ligase family protein [Rhodospirillales bacterium]
MSRLRAYHSLAAAALLFGPIGFLVPLGIAPLLALSALLAIIFKRLDEKSWPYFEKEHLYFIGAFILWGGLSSLWAIVPQDALKQTFILTLVFFAGLVLFDVGRNMVSSEKKAIGNSFFIGFAVTLFLIAFEYFTNGLFAQNIRGASPSQPLYIYTRSASILALLPWLLLLLSGNFNFVISKWIFFIAGILCIAVFENETAIVAILIGTFIYILARFTPYKYSKYLGILTLICVLIAPVFPKTIMSHDFLSQALNPTNGLAFYSLKHRFDIWGFTADKIIEKPLVGWGLNSARSIPGGQESIDKVSHGQLMPLHPHNGVLQIWLELGVVGALFLAGLLWYLLKEIRDAALSKESKAVMAASLVTGLIIFSSSYGIWQGWWMCTLIFTGLFMYCLAPRIED